ncbi:hypothetical protein U1Q18_001828 [Sarracenia purpurea var. burkii]
MAPQRPYSPSLVDRTRFRSLEDETRFHSLFAQQTIRVEKYVLVSDFEGMPVPDWFDRLGWTHVLHVEGKVLLDLVREFYLNMYDLQIQNYSFKTFVRGQDITFDHPTLYEYMGLHEIVHDDYSPLPAEIPYTFSYITSILSRGQQKIMV